MPEVMAKMKGLGWLSAWRLLLCLLCALISHQALADVSATGNIDCSGSTGNNELMDFGVLAPSQPFQYEVSGRCKTMTMWPGGDFFSVAQTWYQHTGPQLKVVETTRNTDIVDDSSATGPCFLCRLAAVGTAFDFTFSITGVTGTLPGIYVARVQFFARSSVWPYKDSLPGTTLLYTIAQPVCSLGSAADLSLLFGTLSSNDFATTQRIAEISLNCPDAVQVDATLVPTQSVVSGSAGVSATTLEGLSMAVTWADNSTAVAFNSPRTFSLSKGSNLIRLGLRPQLNAGASPTGAFSSQYTLNITYP
ncbi:Peptide synthetase [Pseudomonas orientalis]|uniref:fimbrial protein n=1 Tax=Pseudomonas orientalis TaxID=76758 RepID=UPI000F589801|nr:fimbrial protein [Pseudomonas orientalis]AZE95468.1 Peptide synthetase [Pseudomonas orientalis]